MSSLCIYQTLIVFVYFIVRSTCDEVDCDEEIEFNGRFLGHIISPNAAPIDPVAVGLDDSYICFDTELFDFSKKCKMADVVSCGSFGDVNACNDRIVDIRNFYIWKNGVSMTFGGVTSTHPMISGSEGSQIWSSVYASFPTTDNLMESSIDCEGRREKRGFLKINSDGTANFDEYQVFELTCSGSSNHNEDDDSSSALMEVNNERDNLNVGEYLIVDLSDSVLVSVWCLIIVFMVVNIVMIWYFFKKESKKITFDDDASSNKINI